MTMVAVLVGILAILGLAQGDPLGFQSSEPAFIESLRNVGSRVVGGWPAEDEQIPHQVSIRMVRGDGQVSSCGGSIIHHEWVITAAHCLANRDTFVVRLGLTNLTRPLYIVETSQKFIHPNYNEFSSTVQLDDIALLGLGRFIPYGPTIQPCRLQNSADMNVNYQGVVLTVSGYGLTDDVINGGTSSEILRWTFLRGISNEECQQWYSPRSVQGQTVCAEYYNDTAQSSCQGDSGGPLTLVDIDGKPTMIGVVSFGSSAGCNSPFPSAYVRPGWYHEWFLEVTGINFDWSRDDLETEDQQPEDDNGPGGENEPEDGGEPDDEREPEDEKEPEDDGEPDGETEDENGPEDDGEPDDEREPEDENEPENGPEDVESPKVVQFGY